MKRILKLYHQNRYFYNCFLTWYFFLSCIVFSIPKQESFLFINSKHSLFFDYFFTVITQFGDGIFVIALALICFFLWSRRLAVAIAATYIGSGLICSLLKRTFHTHRPGFSLHDDPNFHSLSWMPMSYHNAFPSCHTTSAFALATCIALYSRNRSLSILAFLLACLTGYSRVYLGQHYLDDVWFGSMLGIGFSCLYALLVSYYSENRFTLSNLPSNFKI